MHAHLHIRAKCTDDENAANAWYTAPAKRIRKICGSGALSGRRVRRRTKGAESEHVRARGSTGTGLESESLRSSTVRVSYAIRVAMNRGIYALNSASLDRFALGRAPRRHRARGERKTFGRCGPAWAGGRARKRQAPEREQHALQRARTAYDFLPPAPTADLLTSRAHLANRASLSWRSKT
jgi:hypothetical protein